MSCHLHYSFRERKEGLFHSLKKNGLVYEFDPKKKTSKQKSTSTIPDVCVCKSVSVCNISVHSCMFVRVFICVVCVAKLSVEMSRQPRLQQCRRKTNALRLTVHFKVKDYGIAGLWLNGGPSPLLPLAFTPRPAVGKQLEAATVP